MTLAARFSTSPGFEPQWKLVCCSRSWAAKQFLLILLALLAARSNAIFADTIRVVSWDLQPKATVTGSTNSAAASSDPELIQAAAQTLNNLQPDVLLLQGVRDWQMCNDLAQALKPADYTVAICSSFRRTMGADPAAQEVAILVRHKAYFSWSESWHSPEGLKVPGGYAFAALEVGERRVGVFSTQVGEPQMPALTAQQILDQIDSVKHWQTNQAQTYIIGSSFNLAPNSAAPVQAKLFHFLRTAGLQDVFISAQQDGSFEPSAVRGPRPADFILADTAGFALHPAMPSSTLSDRRPVLCEVEIDPVRVATASAARAELAGGSEPTTVSAQDTNRGPPGASATTVAHATPRWDIPKIARWAAAGLTALMVLLVLNWLLGRRSAGPVRAPALLPERVDPRGRAATTAYTVVVAPHSVTGSLVDEATAPHPQPVIQIEAPATTQTQSGSWQQRALAAEEEARHAQELLRQGLVSQLSQWLKQKLVRKLIADRAQLLEAQQEAARKAFKVDERLNRIEQQIREQNQAYERRIEELNRQLLAAKEESRELIRARIVQVKAEMEAARARLLAKAQEQE